MNDRKLKTVRPRLEALMAQDSDLLKLLVKKRSIRFSRPR
jgi:hypothetical protein